MLSEHWHSGFLRINSKGECFISQQGESSDFDEIKVKKESVGQMVEILCSEKMEVYEGDVLKIKEATINEYDFLGIVYFQDSTFCLKRIQQSEAALKNGYSDLVRFWKDGSHDHHSLEMLNDGYCKIEVIGNVFDDDESFFSHL